MLTPAFIWHSARAPSLSLTSHTEQLHSRPYVPGSNATSSSKAMNILKPSAEKNNTQGRLLRRQVVYLVFLSVGQIRPAENRVPQQNLAVAFTKFCFEVMLLTQKCFRRISLTKLDFQNKTQCTLHGGSWEKFLSDVGAKSSYNHSEKMVSLYSSKCFLFQLSHRKPRGEVLAPASYA